MTPEDVTPFASSVAHHLIPCQAEDYEVSMAVHQVENEVNETEEEEEAEDFDKEADTSMAVHKLSEMEPKSEFENLPRSLASHLVLPVELPETGLLSSMVAHQIYQHNPEHIEETIPLMPSFDCETMSPQEQNEDTFEDNLREHLKDWLMGVDFKATYDNFEEDQSETTFVEYSAEIISMDYEVPMDIGQIEDEDKALEENVEEVEKESDDSNISHRLPTVEDEDVENLDKEAEISMASLKLSEVEPESDFLSLPASLASHLVLPVEWPETGLLSSMVAHQIFQPGLENLEESIPLMPSPTCESISATSAKEPNKDTFEDNLRENIKDWFEGVNFKATYGNFEEDWPETTFVED